MKPLYLFLGGALAGAAAAMLLTPETGQETRARLLKLLRKKGVLPAGYDYGRGSGEDFEVLMQKITAEINE